MEKKLLIANWKMNGNSEELKNLSSEYTQSFKEQDKIEVVLCPSYPYLSLVNSIISNSPIKLGAQNIAKFTKGSYTGEVSGGMLKDMGCKYIIIGHSERRKYFDETDEDIAEKIQLAAQNNLIPILCVGEEFSKRQDGSYLSIIKEQIRISQIYLEHKAIIAYEPVWSIGTGLVPNAYEISEVINMIKQLVNLPVVYGGSINSENSSTILTINILDGFLVGNASLKANEFKDIYNNILSAN